MIAERALGILAGILACSVIKAGCVAFGIWCNAAAPNFIARALATYQQRGKWSFVLGVVNAAALFLMFVILANLKIKVLGMLGVLLLAALICLALTGCSLAYHDLGQRIRGENNWSSARTILLGGITAEAAFLAPVIGQLFSIAVLFRGLGAVVSALLRRSV